MTYVITVAQPGFAGRKAKYRVAVAPTTDACCLDARTRRGKAAGIRVAYVRGNQIDAVRMALQMMTVR